MRIAEIVTIRKPNGPVYVAADIVRELINRPDVEGVDVYYFDDSEANIFPSNVSCYKLDFKKAIDFSKYTVVHTHMIRPDWYMRYHYALWSKSCCRWVSTIHQQTWKDLGFRFGKLKAAVIKIVWDYCLRRASAVVAVGKTIQEEYSFVDARLIYNGVNDAPLETMDDRDRDLAHIRWSGRHIVGGIANLIKRKGFEQIIAAMQKLHDWELVLIGDGVERQNLIQQARESGVLDRVHLIGARQNGARYLPLFDVFVLSSRSEGCCLSGLEANRAGLPIVASRIAPFQEIYSETDVAYFDLDDINSLVNAVKYAYQKKEYLGARSRSLFNDKFNAMRMAKEYISLFKEL